MTDELMCKCGHPIMQHSLVGCLCRIEKGRYCKCAITIDDFIHEARYWAGVIYRRALKADVLLDKVLETTANYAEENVALRLKLEEAEKERDYWIKLWHRHQDMTK